MKRGFALITDETGSSIYSVKSVNKKENFLVQLSDGQIRAKVERADGVLVVGSSLMVFSSFRFIRHAHANKVPVAALNQGVTRADDLFTFKVAEPADQLDAIIAR